MYKLKLEVCAGALVMTTIVFYWMYRMGLCEWNVFAHIRMDFARTSLLYYIIFISGVLIYLGFYTLWVSWSHVLWISLLPAAFFVCCCIRFMPGIYIAGMIGFAGKLIIEFLHIGDVAERVKMPRGMRIKELYISVVTKCVLQMPIYTAVLSLIVFSADYYY